MSTGTTPTTPAPTPAPATNPALAELEKLVAQAKATGATTEGDVVATVTALSAEVEAAFANLVTVIKGALPSLANSPAVTQFEAAVKADVAIAAQTLESTVLTQLATRLATLVGAAAVAAPK